MDESAVATPAAEVSNTPGQKYSRVQCLVLYSLTFTTFGLAASIVGPTASALATNAHCQETDLGPLFFISGLVCLVGSFPGGWLADKGPAHVVLGFSLLSEAIAFAFIPKCTSLTCLIAVYSAACFTFNFLNTIVNTLTVWTDPANFRTWLNFVNTLFGAGSMLTPLLATAAHRFLGSILTAYWIVAACAALCGLLCFTAAAPPAPSTPAPAQSKPESAEDSSAKSTSYWCLVLSVVLLLGLCVGSEVSYGAWIFTYSHKYLDLSVDAAEAVNSTFWAAFTVARVLATLVAAWMHPATMLLLSIPLALLGTALPLLLPTSWLHSGALFLCAALAGAGASTGYANTVSLFGHYSPMQGLVMGLFSAASSIGCMVMPLVMALLARHTSMGYQSVMLVLSVSYGMQIMLVGLCMVAGQRYAAQHALPEVLQPLLDDAEGADGGDPEAAR